MIRIIFKFRTNYFIRCKVEDGLILYFPHGLMCDWLIKLKISHDLLVSKILSITHLLTIPVHSNKIGNLFFFFSYYLVISIRQLLLLGFKGYERKIKIKANWLSFFIIELFFLKIFQKLIHYRLKLNSHQQFRRST